MRSRVEARLAVLLAGASLALAPGCRRDEVTHVRVPKEAAEPLDAGAAPAGSPRSAPAAPDGAAQSPPVPAGRGALKWTLPGGWSQGESGGMRYATLKPSVPGRIDVSVVVLPGAAGGELANVNRWRGQIGLAALDEAALASARSVLRTRAGTVALYDFASEGQSRSRMVAGLLASGDGNTWFLKMVGDEAPVGAARPDFLHLLETLRFD